MASSLRQSGVRDSTSVRRVLIVDDNADSAELLVLVLSQAGYDPRAATSPAQALAVAEEFCPHVALIDIGLPDMDGYELLSALREKPALHGCRFIAVTGHATDDAILRSREAGFECHLTKPVDFQLVLRAVALGEQAVTPDG